MGGGATGETGGRVFRLLKSERLMAGREGRLQANLFKSLRERAPPDVDRLIRPDCSIRSRPRAAETSYFFKGDSHDCSAVGCRDDVHLERCGHFEDCFRKDGTWLVRNSHMEGGAI